MSLIFYTSSQTSLPGPEDQASDFLFKKAGHVAAYAILGLLALRAAWGFKRPALYAILISILYAISDEFHQSFVPEREATFRDVVIDSVAAAAAVIMVWLRAQRGPDQSYPEDQRNND